MSIAPATKKLVVGPEMNGVCMTPEEFDAIEDWDELYNYELIHGVLVVNPAPLDAEVGPNEMLGHWLLQYQEYHPQGKALDATLPERMLRTPDSRRRGDRSIWAGLGRKPNTREDTPTIVVEFVSAGRRNWLRDYIEKRDEYMALGVMEYWIVNRFQRTLTVYRKRGKRWKELVILESETYQTPLLPGFELPLGNLLAVADRWEE